MALLLSVYPLWGVARGDAPDDGVGRGVRTAAVHLRGGRVFRAGARAFVVNDFTVAYVAGSSNAAAGVVPGVAATGAHEGSYCCVGAADERGWTTAVAVFNRQVPADIVARVRWR